MSLLAGPGLDLRTALVGDARLVVVADTLEVDGAWLLAHMAAGALEAGRHVLLVVADPGSAESWRTALRKAGCSSALMTERLRLVEAGDSVSHADAARAAAAGEGRSVVILADASASMDERGCTFDASGADDVVALADDAACVCARVRGELIPAAAALAQGPDGAPSSRDGAGDSAEAQLWASADLVVSLTPLPSGAASGVTGIVGVNDRCGPCGSSRSPFRATEAGVRIGAV